MTSALLIIDMQSENAEYLEPRDRQELVLNIKELAQRARKKKAFVIQTRMWITDPKETSLTRIYPRDGHSTNKDIGIIPELNNLKYDVMIDKTNYSCFYNTTLDEFIAKHNITRLIITGINTDFCVFATALDAYYRNLDVVIVEDAVASVAGASAHEQALNHLRVMTDPEIIAVKDIEF